MSSFNRLRRLASPSFARPPNICSGCWRQRRQQLRFAHNNPADDPNWISVADAPSKLVRTGQKHGPGLIILALIPITAFALGTWQVQRLDWKTKLITTFEDRLIKPPLPLPPVVDPDAVTDFEYRRVYAKGHLRHDQEMLIGPRMNDGKDGYLVVTPLERGNGESTILVNRGWIPKSLKSQSDRPEGVPAGEVVVEGLLRSPWKKNMFTPDNKPEEGKFYFPDVEQMAELTGSQPIWVEETMGTLFVEVLSQPTDQSQCRNSWSNIAGKQAAFQLAVLPKSISEITIPSTFSRGAFSTKHEYFAFYS
ncbi:surf-like protein [Ophidiomyces ophidiicola]|nr:surf-like protein [Ophidiomyces ophidiicola]